MTPKKQHSISEAIQRSKEQKHPIRIYTNTPPEYCDGIVVHITTDLIILAVEIDFRFDGFFVVPKKYISDVRFSEIETHVDAIMKHVQTKKGLKVPTWVSRISSLQDVCLALKKQHIWGHMTTAHKKEYGTYIGPITDTTDTSVSIHVSTVTAQWDDVYTLPYSRIVHITWGNHYTSSFQSYMEGKKK